MQEQLRALDRGRPARPIVKICNRVLELPVWNGPGGVASNVSLRPEIAP